MRLIRHEQIVISICLLLVILLSWAYLFAGAGTMTDMGGAAMPMSAWPWSATHAMVMFFMWVVMMAAMMLPSAAPVILLYSTISHRREAEGVVASTIFFIGYVAVWGGFSLLALLVQFVLEWAALLSPMMETASAVLSGILLMCAGLYQFTPLKRSCLRLCRSPMEFLMLHWRSGKSGAFVMGGKHGLYCVGCCWGLMLLLFVGGLMNLLWIAALAVFIFVEKIVPGGHALGKIGGFWLVISGVILLVRSGGG